MTLSSVSWGTCTLPCPKGPAASAEAGVAAQGPQFEKHWVSSCLGFPQSPGL